MGAERVPLLLAPNLVAETKNLHCSTVSTCGTMILAPASIAYSINDWSWPGTLYHSAPWFPSRVSDSSYRTNGMVRPRSWIWCREQSTGDQGQRSSETANDNPTHCCHRFNIARRVFPIKPNGIEAKRGQEPAYRNRRNSVETHNIGGILPIPNSLTGIMGLEQRRSRIFVHIVTNDFGSPRREDSCE